MAKVIKAGKWEYTEEELQQMFEEATRRGEEAMKTEITASSVRYDQASGRLILELKNGSTFIVPSDLIQGLRDAEPELIAKAKLGPRGASLHWAKLDVDFSVGGLLEGRFGTKKWMEQLPQLLAEQKASRKPSTKRSTNVGSVGAANVPASNGRRRSRQVA
ncbi:MAG: DUF2442 domain-containing protein [Blastocatellia bacterium]